MTDKKMWKVLAPVERNGVTHWMKLGVGFTNKDDSLNLILDALPISFLAGKELKIQVREYDEEDARRRDSAGTPKFTPRPSAQPTHAADVPF